MVEKIELCFALLYLGLIRFKPTLNICVGLNLSQRLRTTARASSAGVKRKRVYTRLTFHICWDLVRFAIGTFVVVLLTLSTKSENSSFCMEFRIKFVSEATILFGEGIM